MATKNVDIVFRTKGSKKAESEFKSLGQSVSGVIDKLTSLRSIAGVAFATLAAKAGYDLAKTAAAAGDVRRAFENLNRPDLLNRMREATRGTASDVELMTQAVMANNFQISLEQLPTLFEFASRRARETGQSVDYLVQSIITGIGRKSPLILDNLGLSAVRIREEFNKSGDMAEAVGNIIRQEMSGAQKQTEYAADVFERYTATIENASDRIGRALIPIATDVVETATTAVEAISGLFRDFEQETRDASMVVVQTINNLNDLIDVQNVISALRELGRSVLESGNVGNVKMMVQNFSLLTKEEKNAVMAGSDFWEVQQAIADAANNLEDRFKEAVKGFKAFNMETDVLNISTGNATEKTKELAQAVLAVSENFSSFEILPENAMRIGKSLVIVKNITEDTIEVTERYGTALEATYGPAIAAQANMLASSLQNAVVNQWESGENALKNFGKTFENLAAQIASRAAIFGLFSLIPGFGSFLGAGFGEFVFGRQHGGRVTPGQRYRVGEAGPETFVPDRSGSIVPKHKEGSTFNLHFHGAVTNERFVKDTILPAIRGAQRRGF